jgi:hypothetical protein
MHYERAARFKRLSLDEAWPLLRDCKVSLRGAYWAYREFYRWDPSPAPRCTMARSNTRPNTSSMRTEFVGYVVVWLPRPWSCSATLACS